MPKRKDPAQERSIIVSHPEKRPYGAQLTFKVLDKGFLGDIENATFFFDDGKYATLAPERQVSWEGGELFSLTLEGFATASEAENYGRKLVQALLCTSINLNYGVRLIYRTHQPIIVFNRLHSPGSSAWGEGRVILPIRWSIEKLQNAYMMTKSVDQQMLLSMEIFSGSSLEASSKAIFLSTVSALEPLAVRKKLGSAVNKFIDECLARFQKNDKIPSEYRESIRNRLFQLKEESIRQALLRLIREKIPDDESAPAVIDYAYNLRSQLIHNGIADDPDIDFSVETMKVASIVKKLYAKKLGKVIDSF